MATRQIWPVLASLLAVILLPSLVLPSPKASRKPVDEGVLFLGVAGSPNGQVALAVGEQGRILRRLSGDAEWSLMPPGSDPTATDPVSALEPSRNEGDPAESPAEEGGSPESPSGSVGSSAAGRTARPTDALLTRVLFADETRVWAAGHDATIIASSDGGKTWTLQFSDPEAEAPFLDLWFEDGEHGLAIGAYGLAYETFDSGANWESRELVPEGPHLYSITESPAGSLYVAGEFGTLIRSADFGETWAELEVPYEGTFFGVLALSDESVLIFGLRGNLYRSEDGGSSWTQVDAGTSSSLLAGRELADGTVVLVGLAGTILESQDQGRSFRQRNRSDRRALTGITELAGEVWLSSDQGLITLAEDPR